MEPAQLTAGWDTCPACGSADLGAFGGEYSSPGPVWVETQVCHRCGTVFDQVYEPARREIVPGVAPGEGKE